MLKRDDCHIVYVLCPANIETGGPDALHQMVFYLKEIGVDAKIAYIADNKKNVSIPGRYKCYVDEFILKDEIVDDSNSSVIIPEHCVSEIRRFTKSNVFIWWLSVDNNIALPFYKRLFYVLKMPLLYLKHRNLFKNRVFTVVKSVLFAKTYQFEKEFSNITHLCASYYALEYVSRRSHNCVIKCIEPISRQFLDIYASEKKDISRENRNNVILYNPVRKYDDILKKIAAQAPELRFEPLQGLNLQQLIEKYKTSKLYIDFGAFPGAERIPKEAVLFGCAIITGRRGASGYYGDVPIPDEYKFDKPIFQIDEIVKKIRFVLNNYGKVYSDFDEYREMVLKLEENFIKSLKGIFEN